MMNSVFLRDFEFPARPVARPSLTDGELLDPRLVAELIRLLFVIQRASFDDGEWEEVNRIFLSLCDAFSNGGVRGLRAVRDCIRAEEPSGSSGLAGGALDRLPGRDGSGDVVEALRRIVAPAIADAF